MPRINMERMCRIDSFFFHIFIWVCGFSLFAGIYSSDNAV
jgi:hypothetical protein